MADAGSDWMIGKDYVEDRRVGDVAVMENCWVVLD